MASTPKKTDRMKYLQFMILVLIVACASREEKPKTTTIAFGSCSHEFDSLQQWDNVMLHNPYGLGLAWRQHLWRHI